MKETKWCLSTFLFLFLGIGIILDLPFIRPLLLPTWVALAFLILSLCSLLVFNDIFRNNGSNLDKYLERADYDKNEYKALYWGALISLLPIALFSFYYPALSFDNLQSGNIATTVAQILATIFAITISVTLLSLEYFSQQLSSRIVQSFLRSHFIIIVVGSYLLMIPILLYSISLLSPSNSTKVALVAIVWGLVCLLSYAIFMYDRIDPISQIEVVENQIPDDFDNEILCKMEAGRITAEDPFDRFIDVSNITRRLLQKGELFVFSQWISFFFDIERGYISKRYDIYVSGEANRDGIYDEIDDITEYFSFMNSNILLEVKSNNDARFFPPYIRLLADRFEYAIEIKQESKINNLMDEYIDMLIFCLMNDTRVNLYRTILESSMNSYITSYISMGEYSVKYSNTDNSENWQTVWQLYFKDNFRKVRKRLVSLSEEKISRGDRDITLFMSQLLDSFLKTVIETDGILDLRKELIEWIIITYSRIYLIAIDAEMSFLYIDIKKIILGESLNDEQVELIIHMIDEYEEFVIDRIEKGDELMIEDIRLSCLGLPEEYPRIINRMMKILFKGVEADMSESPSLLQPIDIILDDYDSRLEDEIILEAEAILYRYEYETPDYRK